MQRTNSSLTRYLESQHLASDEDMLLVGKRASQPSIRIDSCGTSPPQPATQIEIVDFIVPVDEENRPRHQRNSSTTLSTDSGRSLHSISAIPLLHTGSPESISVPQLDESIRPVLLRAPEYLYSSKAFKVLIFLDVSMVAAPFLLLYVVMWTGYPQAGNILLQTGVLIRTGLPIIIVPHIIWFAIMMPFSRATKR
jgi:hypothetical protein